MKQLVGGLYKKSPASVAGPLPILVEFHDHARTASSGQTRTHDTAAKDVSAARRTCAVRARQMQQQQRRSGRTGRHRDGTPGRTSHRGCAAMRTAPTPIDATIAQRRPGLLHCAVRAICLGAGQTMGKEIPWFPSRNNRPRAAVAGDCGRSVS